MNQHPLHRNAVLFGSRGTYQIQSVIGQGGFGITYIATASASDDCLPGRVAIKEFFPREMSSRASDGEDVIIDSVDKISLINQLRDRFVKESRNIQTCDHPSIVKVLDTVEANGTAYMVMELVDGKTLREYIEEHGALSNSDAANIILKVALALKYLHDKKITHLDIKPDNIMISPDGMKITIIDFGLSRQFNDDGSSDSQIITAVSKGYAAPEQYYGISKFSPQSDVYSMGATLYKLVTGNTPPEPNVIESNKSALWFPAAVSEPIRDAILMTMEPDSHKRVNTALEFIKILNGQRKNVITKPVAVKPEIEADSGHSVGKIVLNILFVALMGLAVYLIRDEWSHKWHKFNNYFHQNHEEYLISMSAVCIMAFIGLMSRGRTLKAVIFTIALLGFGFVFLNTV